MGAIMGELLLRNIEAGKEAAGYDELGQHLRWMERFRFEYSRGG